jgi:predicted dehydrogenase
MQKGQDYAPVMTPTKPVCEPGEFVIAAAFADHGHLFGMVSNLLAAGATLGYVYEPDEAKASKLLALDPAAKRVETFDAILQAPDVRLVAAAAIPNLRAAVGIRVLPSG